MKYCLRVCVCNLQVLEATKAVTTTTVQSVDMDFEQGTIVNSLPYENIFDRPKLITLAKKK